MSAESPDLFTLLGRAADQWAAITGVERVLRKKSWNMDDMRLREDYTALHEALTDDPSGITGALTLKCLTQALESRGGLTLANVLDMPDWLTAKLGPLRDLRAVMGSRPVVDALAAGAANVTAALDHYGAASRADIQQAIADTGQLAMLYRSALRSAKTLQLDQFMVGAGEPTSYRPMFVRHVHEWWNINSLLEGMMDMPSGISLNLIRHPSGYESYFVFAIRNGANLYLLGDKELEAHPLQGGMRRRPDRVLDERSGQHWFPYDLLDMQVSQEGRGYFKAASGATDIVARQKVAHRLVEIKDLGCNEVIWTAMMFGHILDRIWKPELRCPSLSYTGEMLVSPLALPGHAGIANLPAPLYQPIQLAPLSTSQVMEGLGVEDLGKLGQSPHLWMLDRYKDQVRPDTLNALVAPGERIAIDFRAGQLRRLSSKTELDSLEAGQQTARFFGHPEPEITLIAAMDATRYGSQQQLDADRKFIARTAMTNQVMALARTEYERRKDEMTSWWETALAANLDRVLSLAAHPSVWVEAIEAPGTRSFYDYAGSVSTNGKDGEASRVARSLVRREDKCGFGRVYGMKDGIWKPRCPITGSRPAQWAVICPGSAAELAYLAGCEVADLPDVLQGFSLADVSHGNAILNRIDPALWNLRDPWRKLDFRVQVPLSKRGVVQIEKRRAPLPLAGIVSYEESPYGEASRSQFSIRIGGPD